MNAVIGSANFRRCASLVLLALLGASLWAGGGKQIETVTAEGGEIWQNDYNVTKRRRGTYNYIVYARDRAGNEAVAGPRNIRIDPRTGAPVARFMYPADNAIIRESINLLGIAAARYSVGQVVVRLDNGEWLEVSGAEYWSRFIEFNEVPDGRHSFSVQSFDTKGMPSRIEKVNFILDTSPPTIELLSHKVGDIISGNVNFRGTAGDPNGLSRLEYSTDGENYRSLSGRTRGTSVNFSIPVATKREGEGPLILYIRAIDNTGVVTEYPYLFFVDNEGPQLELYSPVQGEDVYGNFVLSGRAYDSLGITNLYYEWGKAREPIQMRPGDPYWTVPLEMVAGSATSIKVTAVDKIGNTSSVTARLEDRRRVKVPVLVIEYPPVASLNALPADASIYGRIEDGITGHAVLIEGFGEVEAMNSFRITPDMIPQGRGNLRLIPIGFDGTRGAAVNLRYNKVEASSQHRASEISISNPPKYSWQSGLNLSLSGMIRPAGAQLEYRLGPQDNWRPIAADYAGNFSEQLSMSDRPHGPVHLELRTSYSGYANYPVYHPFNRALAGPDIRFASPPAGGDMVYGSKTVIGSIEHAVPIRSIAYTLDRFEYNEINYTSRYGKAWFSYFCDFNSLRERDEHIFFRIVDAAGDVFNVEPDYIINPTPPLPNLIVNTPGDDMVITNPFDISGLAYYDTGISSIQWRILGPKIESISIGAAGDRARDAYRVFQYNPNPEFNRLLTEQSFQIPIDFTMIGDGEYDIEIFATDIYGVQSETIKRTIKVSTAPPDTKILFPAIVNYNHHAILVQGESTDANAIASVTLSMDNGVTWQEIPVGGDDNWELALNTIAYVDGIYSALIVTEDKYGISTFSNAMINIDNTPPELYISYPANGQHVGTNMQITGRVSDNVELRNLNFQVISAANPNLQYTFEVAPELVVFQNISFADLPQGEYIIRIVSRDLADNESIVSRNVVYDADDNAAQIAIFNPQPGESHTGPINVVGLVTGVTLPESVRITLDGRILTLAYVDRYGVFSYQIPEAMLTEETAYQIAVNYNSETGRAISSPIHTVHYSPYGPGLVVNSHYDGEVITKRPWLSGRAWMTAPRPAGGAGGTRDFTRQEKAEMAVQYVEISYDNGRTFSKAKGKEQWKHRLETSLLPAGPQPVVVRSRFANGEDAVRRLLLIVDTTTPLVDAIAPLEKTTHRDNVLVFGTASDNYELGDVNVSLRPYSKFWYSVPGPLQGLYFDVKALGATDFDVGLGISLFDDNVRFQGQFGMTPGDGTDTMMRSGGRYTGYAIGIKLLANIFHLPFDYMFGPDWGFYSMNLALGANFSWFTMHEWSGQQPRTALYMGAILAQWDIANIDLQYFHPRWKYFHRFAVYLEPELWFASSDVQAEMIFRVSVGLRLNWF